MVNLEYAINDAIKAEAAAYAPLELRFAQDKYDAAQKAIEEKDYHQAERLIDQAQLDAQCAREKALSAKAEKDADDMRQKHRVAAKRNRAAQEKSLTEWSQSMRQLRAYAAAGLLLALLAACSSIPANQPDLVRARSSYTSAKAKAWVNEYAPVEMYEAEQALQHAEQARSVDEMKHLSYIADRKVQIAVAVANRKLSSDAVSEIGREKDQVLQDARDAEIDYERKRADKLAAELAELKAKQAAAELKAKQAADDNAALAALNAGKTDRGMALTLADSHFEPGTAQLLSGASGTLDQVAVFLNSHLDRDVMIEGHAGSGLPQNDALELSQRRADAVRDALLSRQVQPGRIVSKVSGNDGAANQAVDIIILDPGVKPNL